MKDKIFVTFLCATLCVVTNAMGAGGDGSGKCKVRFKVRPRDAERYDASNGSYVWLKDDLLFISDNGAVRCGEGYCGNGVEIMKLGDDIKVGYDDYVYRCTVTGGTGKWQKVELGVDVPFCEDSEIKVPEFKNADYVVDTDRHDLEKFFGVGYYISTEGFCAISCCKNYYRYFNGKCVHKECKELIESDKAKGWDDENNACLCNDTANAEWRDNNCVCKDTVNAKMDDDGKCVCKDEGMEFDEDGNCVKKAAESNDGTGNQNEENPGKTACEGLISSGRATKWDDANNTCLCKDTTNAEWKDNDCVCKDDGKEFDEDGNCVKKVAESNAETGDQNEENPGKTACEGLISSGRATEWNDANNTCLCKDTTNAEWKDNDCVCKDAVNAKMGDGGKCVCDAGMEFDKDGKCVQKSNKIDELGSWLDAETGKFERSKWRDAEGKFNTARLASDSIAAVVLGTAGGLISSKVIKKKQVENGFEDIKCTIGSQEVADWGDEFQVGIQ